MLVTPKHPLIMLSREFAEICKPLELLHIQQLTYLKQFNDDTRLGLSNRPEWIQDYYNLKLYESSLFEDEPSHYKAEYQVWLGDYDLDVYRHGRTRYNTENCISITEPQPDGCEHYLFSVTPENAQVVHYLANNIDILYHFILYLKDKGVTILKNAKKSRIKVQESFIGSSKTEIAMSDNNFYEQMKNAKDLFLRKTPISRYLIESGYNNRIKLSQREIGCVICLLQDNTAKEIAYHLNISHRTVESYLNNVKLKLNCDTKADLVKKLKQDKYLASLKC